MKAALRGSYVEFVIYNGVTERYPEWFANELYECTHTDESRFTFYVFQGERRPDYHEKQLIEDHSVFLRKPNGEVHLTDYDVFKSLYHVYIYDGFTNSGIAALKEDSIDYVECVGGVLLKEYPAWFYEFYTEAVNLPGGETVYIHDAHDHDTSYGKFRGPYLSVSENGEISIDSHSVFLRNRFGEIRAMYYHDFKRFYDPDPEINQLGEFEDVTRYGSVERKDRPVRRPRGR